MAKKTDTRIQFTKHALKEALIRLMQQKPVTQVTVKELCEEAGINRSTFYLHYAAPEEVLQEIQADFLRENSGIFGAAFAEKDAAKSSDYLKKIFDLMRTRRDVCAALFGRNGSPYFLANIREMSREIVLSEWHAEFPTVAKEKLNFAYDFVFPACMGLILEWLAGRGEELPFDTLAMRLERLGHYCLVAATEFQ